MKVSLVMPVLNEISGLRQILPRIQRESVDQLIVLDGGSTDGSVEFALEQGWEVHKQTRKGLRLAYIEVYEKIKGDVIITFSPDGNSIPELLPRLIDEMRKGHDMVIVSRYLPPARSEDDTLLTRLGNFMFTRMINLLFGGRYSDALVIYRAYRRAIPQDLGMTEIRSAVYERWIGRYISWEPQLSVRCAKLKLRVAEIPGDEPPRLGDKIGGGFFLPASRIYHFRSGLACLYMILEELWRGGRTGR